MFLFFKKQQKAKLYKLLEVNILRPLHPPHLSILSHQKKTALILVSFFSDT